MHLKMKIEFFILVARRHGTTLISEGNQLPHRSRKRNYAGLRFATNRFALGQIGNIPNKESEARAKSRTKI